MITLLKIAVIAVALALASIQDVKTREIDDRVWWAAIPIGGILTAAEVIVTPGYPLVVAGASIALSLLLAFGVYYIGLYGGADAKALAAIAVTMPLPVAGVVGGGSPFYPLTVLGNALLLSLSLIPACMLKNLIWVARGGRLFHGVRASPLQRAGAFFTGFKVTPKTAMSVHFNLIERVSNPGGERYLKLFNKVEEVDEPKVIGEGIGHVWVTPAIPMIIFIFAGFLVSFLTGDILFRTVSSLLGPFF